MDVCFDFDVPAFRRHVTIFSSHPQYPKGSLPFGFSAQHTDAVDIPPMRSTHAVRLLINMIILIESFKQEL
jgi:hypothetical protein